MEKPIIIPELGDDIREIKIIEWLVKEGDFIRKGETIAILETDKVAFEIESPESGIVKRLEYSKGDKVNVSKPIAYIDYTDDVTISDNENQINQEKSKNLIKTKTNKKSIWDIFKLLKK